MQEQEQHRALRDHASQMQSDLAHLQASSAGAASIAASEKVGRYHAVSEGVRRVGVLPCGRFQVQLFAAAKPF